MKTRIQQFVGRMRGRVSRLGALALAVASFAPAWAGVTITMTNGYLEDPESGDMVAKATLQSGDMAYIMFNEDKCIDSKSGDYIGAFQRWTWEPATVTAADLGEDFDMFSPDTSIVVPTFSGSKTATLKLKAQYVSPVAADVSYTFEYEGWAEEETDYYWSPDGGKTLIPTSVASYPLVAGTIKVSFYAKDTNGNVSASWKAPNTVSLTIPKRTTYKEDGITYYDDVTFLDETEWFVAAEGAKLVYFDANGGKCAVASRWYRDGALDGTYYTLPEPNARSGYVFDGWWTAKTGGAKVEEGVAVDFSLLDAKKPTLYARWLKAYTLTLKGTDVTAEYDGDIYEKSVSVLEGDAVTLTAPDWYEDAKGNGYLFQCWTPSKAYDFGTNYVASSYETTIAMPAATLTMTATYIKESEAAYITMSATAEPVEVGDLPIVADESQFYWSTDGKTWYQNGTTALVKKGTYTIQWKSTSNAWAPPTTKEKVTVVAGDDYYDEDPVEFTFVKAFTLNTVVYANGEWQESAAGGTATMNPTDGKLVTGKSITLTAKANKNYIFVGWQYEKVWDSEGFSPVATDAKYTTSSIQTETYVYDEIGEEYLTVSLLDETDYTVHIQAVFRPTSDYTAEGMHNAIGTVRSNSGVWYAPSYEEGSELNGTVEMLAAVGCETSFSFDSVSSLAKPVTFKQTGKLPSGLKFTASTGVLAGTPKTAGTYDFTVSATDPAGNTCSVAVTLVVRKIDFGTIAGDYRAMMYAANLFSDETGDVQGILEMSVTSAGKVSAKIMTAAGGTVSISSSLVWCPNEMDPDDDGSFSVSYYKSSGNSSSGSSASFYVYFGDCAEGGSSVSYLSQTWKSDTYAMTRMVGTAAYADPDIIQDSDFAASFLGKYYTIALTSEEAESEESESEESEESEETESYRTPMELMLGNGYLTVTTDKKGTIKIAGKLADGEKVSASTVLLPSVTTNGDFSASAVLFVVPSSYKKKGYMALQLEFDEDGYVTSSVGTWVTPPLLDAISGCEECGDDELFLSGKLALLADGAFYSKLDDLTNYYLELAVLVPDDANLEYSYTDAGEKIYEYTYPALTMFGLDSDTGMLTGGKNGKITIGKSGSPWKDSDGYYNYDETKAGVEITNPAGLTIAFKPATGIFSGTFKLYYDYETTKAEHKEVKCSYEGVVITDGEEAYGVASAPYSGKYTYQYYTYDKNGNEKAATKTYTKKCAVPVYWTLYAQE